MSLPLILGTGCLGRTPRSEEAGPNKTSEAVAPAGADADLVAQHGALEDVPDEARRTQGKLSRNELIIGWLDEKRLVAVDVDRLVASATSGKKLRVNAISSVVGAVIGQLPIGRDLLLTATDHKDLVRLEPDWRTTDTISIKNVIRSGSDYVAMGSLLPHSRGVLLAVEGGPGISIVDIDVDRWKVRRHVAFADRFAGSPHACLTTSRKIALVWSRGLDLIDADTLERERFIKLGGLPSGVSCVGTEAWVTATEEGRGWVIGSSGAVIGQFGWNGYGSRQLYTSSAGNAIFGTDQEGGSVFRCEAATRACRTTRIGRKPTDLIIVGRHLFVTLEESRAIGVLDADTLSRIGVVRFPGMPRGLAYLP